MARPERNNVDYFPFICEEGKKMYYIEETYGNDGFAVFVKILRELAKTEYHYLNLSKNTTLMFLSAKCKVSKETLESIISDLVELDKFDSILWNENKIIWCQDFIDSIQDAYSKRKNECINLEGLHTLLISLGVRKPIKSKTTTPVNTQSILEDSKVDKSKRKYSKKFTPPSSEEIEKYALEKGHKVNGDKISSYYTSEDPNKWIDGKGNVVKNWKQKVLSVWCKDENKVTSKPQKGYEMSRDAFVHIPKERHNEINSREDETRILNELFPNNGN